MGAGVLNLIDTLDLGELRRERNREVLKEMRELEELWRDNEYLRPEEIYDRWDLRNRTFPYCIGVIGSRTFKDQSLFNEVMQRIIMLHIENNIKIISGGARGADTMANWFAQENGFPFTEYLPDWDRYGKRAGYIRNTQIVESSHEVVAFWDGKSKGTAMSLYLCKTHHVPVTIIEYNK